MRSSRVAPSSGVAFRSANSSAEQRPCGRGRSLSELRELRLAAAVVGEVVVAVGDLGPLDGDRRGVGAVEHQGDQPGRVGLEGQAGHPVHQPDLLHVVARVVRVDRGGLGGLGLGAYVPTRRRWPSDARRRGRPSRYWSSRSRSPRPESAADRPAWSATASMMLAPSSSRRSCRSISVVGPLQEELAVDRRGRLLAGDQRPGAGPRQAALAALDVDAEGQRGEPRQRGRSARRRTGRARSSCGTRRWPGAGRRSGRRRPRRGCRRRPGARRR